MSEGRKVAAIAIDSSGRSHDRYALLERLEDDSVSSLLRVHDRLRDEEVALRTILKANHEIQVSRDLICRYGKVDHPFLTRILDCGQQQDCLFYTREDVRGSELSEVLSARKEEWIFRLFLEGLDGLAALHDAGLSHGLVTPHYLKAGLVGNRLGGLRITDAGLRFLQHGNTGQRAYDSPEVRKGAEPTPSNDVYQLAATVLGALGGANGLAALEQGDQKPFRSYGKGLDRDLLELLDGFVLPDRNKRPGKASDALRIVKAADWRRPEQTPSLERVLSPEFVGNERALGQLRHLLHEAKRNGTHGAEVLGEEGAGRTRILQEVSAEASANGWHVLRISAYSRSIEQLLDEVRSTLQRGLEHEERRPYSESSDEVRPVVVARQVCAAVEKNSCALLIVADDADRLPVDLQSVLRVLVSEAGPHSLAVIASARRAIDLPGGKRVSLERLEERDVRRLLAPFVAEGINPDLAVSRIHAVSGGNPLWLRLILASWIQSGQLRLTRGRLFFDDRVVTPIPKDVQEAVGKIAERLSPAELSVLQGLAVWGMPMSAAMAEKLFDGEHIPEQVTEWDHAGVRIIAGGVGEGILASLAPSHRQEWHGRILEVLDPSGVDSRTYATHLLGAGRTSESAEVLLRSGDMAVAAGDVRAAWGDLRTLLEQIPSDDIGGLKREEIALRAAQMGARIGEQSWVRSILAQLPAGTGRGAQASRYRYDVMLLRANSLRDQHHFDEAARQYSEARALAGKSRNLADKLPEVAFEEASNDLNRGEYVAGVQRLLDVMSALEVSSNIELYANALHRLAALEGRSGEIVSAIQHGQRAVRLGLRMNDSLLVARGSTTLALWYQRLGKPDRALHALDRAERSLKRCPHDGYRSSLLERRAQIYLDRGQYNDAEQSLLEAETLRRRMGDHTHLPIVLLELGRFYRRQGHLAQAAERYREAIVLAEEFNSYVVTVARADLAELLAFEGEGAAAEPLFRQALQHADQSLKGLVLVLLGRFLGAQGKYAEAVMNVESGGGFLQRHNPSIQFLAHLEMAEVLLAAADPESASFRLALIADDVPPAGEHRATYELLLGRAQGVLGMPFLDHYDRAIEEAEKHNDPTFTAHVLCEVLESVVSLSGAPPEWARANIDRLARNAERTDSRTIAWRTKGLHGVLAKEGQSISGGGNVAIAVQKWLKATGANEVERSLLDSVKNLEQVAGAMVLVIGVDADGKPTVSPMERPADPEQAAVRPYRIASREFDRKIFREALTAVDGNAVEAARMLRLPYSTFRYQAEKLGILKPVRRGSRRKRTDPAR